MERELHERLYSHLKLLNIIHPPSEDYKAIFKKDMFVRSNKSAFFHVVHYLLHILNPEKAKKKLLTWPTCNVKERENKFRGEVLELLNELNIIYEDANLPVMMSSHLLAPGGYRFTNFMYRLTELVIYEDLERVYPDEIFSRPKPCKNEDFNNKMHENLQKINENINYEINSKIDTFDKKFKLFEKEAESISAQSIAVDAEMREIQKNIEKQLSRIDMELNNEHILEKFEALQNKSKIVDKINDIYTECKNLLSHLIDINKSGEILNIVESLQELNISLRRRLSELPIYSVAELELDLEQITQKRNELELIDRQLRDESDTFLETLKVSKEILKHVVTDLNT
ncbi:hypothetical protein WA026_009168 [Henosepilachna vigintioctopunctata]|uniref:HAUS augmin-like complex subunit 6 N-terminal domain-containing protein n=1 Tax=Henosepilachna vigintioctopunctata TaxID=420089 RepID=A0AAW1UVS8_9CUCU